MPEATWSERARQCPWCDATVPRDDTHCPACGASLAQRDSIGGLTIPGVTTVDPALAAYDALPRRLPGNSPSQSMAVGAIGAAAALPGPVALAALGGLAGVAALEYLGAKRGEGAEPVALESVGRPSDVALHVAEQLDRATAARGRSGETGVAGEDGASDQTPGDATHEGRSGTSDEDRAGR